MFSLKDFMRSCKEAKYTEYVDSRQMFSIETIT